MSKRKFLYNNNIYDVYKKRKFYHVSKNYFYY